MKIKDITIPKHLLPELRSFEDWMLLTKLKALRGDELNEFQL